MALICQKHLARVKEDLKGAMNELETFRIEAIESGLDSSKTAFGSENMKVELSVFYRMIEGLDNMLKIRYPNEYK